MLNDASTDGTGDLLESFRDARLRVIHQPKSRGISAALNDLLGATDSRYVARMDADDVVLPGRFHRQLLALRRHDFAFSTAVFINEKGRLTRSQPPLRVSSRLAPALLLTGNYFVHPTMAGRRQVVADLGGYPKTGAEDYALWLRAAASDYRMVRLALPGLAYRRHAGQLTANPRWLGLPSDPVLDEALSRLLSRYLPRVAPLASTLRRSLSGGLRIDDPLLVGALESLPGSITGLHLWERKILRAAIHKAIYRPRRAAWGGEAIA